MHAQDFVDGEIEGGGAPGCEILGEIGGARAGCAPPWIRHCCMYCIVFGLTHTGVVFRELYCGDHDKFHISSADWWDLLLPLA